MYIHRGRTIQRGSGLGSLFRGLMRYVVPIGKKVLSSNVAKRLGKAALSEGVGLAKDVLGGRNVKGSAQSHLKAVRNKIAASLNSSLSGRKKRRKRRAPPPPGRRAPVRRKAKRFRLLR